MQCIIWTNPGGGLCNNLDQTWWRFVWHGIFPTHEVEKLHHFTKMVQYCTIWHHGSTTPMR